MNNTVHNRIFRIARREVFRIATRPLYLFCMIIAPLFCYLFFTTLMWNGRPTDMPAGVVDLDNTATTRSIIRNLEEENGFPIFVRTRSGVSLTPQGKLFLESLRAIQTEMAKISRLPEHFQEKKALSIAAIY